MKPKMKGFDINRYQKQKRINVSWNLKKTRRGDEKDNKGMKRRKKEF